MSCRRNDFHFRMGNARQKLRLQFGDWIDLVQFIGDDQGWNLNLAHSFPDIFRLVDIGQARLASGEPPKASSMT